MADFFIRVLIAASLGSITYVAVFSFFPDRPNIPPTVFASTGAGIGAAIGFFFIPFMFRRAFQASVRRVELIPISAIVAGTLGLIAGLAVASLLAPPLSVLPGPPGRIAPIFVSILLGSIGISVMVSRERDLSQFIRGFFQPESNSTNTSGTTSLRNGQIILDTSAIIDGRILDVSQTGFMGGTFVVPRFILDELRHVADSGDALRRNRGRRGLEMLNKLRTDSDIPIQVADADIDGIREVDAKLVKLAIDLKASIVTTDYNLNRVAEIQGIKVLNVNELANALKPVFLPGEEFSVKVIQEGKEDGQGVGFLDDGTMVVIEGGRRHVGRDTIIQVTRVLQTAAGRIIFAQPKTE